MNPLLRAGTGTRVRLRQLGIRTATDLPKALPPEQIDRRCPAGDGCTPGNFCDLFPETGLDRDQIRTLVRVLDEDTHLAAVWNWQSRGVVARERTRRPRSAGG